MAAAPSTPVTASEGPSAVSVHAVSSCVPPLSLTTVFSRVMFGAASSLVIVQTALTPLASVRVEPCSCPAVHTHVLALYPEGPPDSESSYTPADTSIAVIAASPCEPVMPGVGPEAVSVQSSACAAPPSSFTTTFRSVSVAGLSSFTMVQVALSPTASLILVGVLCVPPSQSHALAAYPAGPVSESEYVPATTARFVIAASPVAPETPAVVPVAVSVHALACAVPPSSFTTCLTSVSSGATSSFTMVQVTCTPFGTAIVLPVRVPRSQLQVPAL